MVLVLVGKKASCKSRHMHYEQTCQPAVCTRMLWTATMCAQTHPPAPARVSPPACRGVAQTVALPPQREPPRCHAAHCQTRWGSRSSRWCCGGELPDASAAGAVQTCTQQRHKRKNTSRQLQLHMCCHQLCVLHPAHNSAAPTAPLRTCTQHEQLTPFPLKP